MFQMHRSWKGPQPAPDPWNVTHTDKEGNFHRVQIFDNGESYFDRYTVKVDGKPFWYGAERAEAEAHFEDQVTKMKER